MYVAMLVPSCGLAAGADRDDGCGNFDARRGLLDAWKAIVGEFIAAHSSPVSLRGGVLSVRVLQPALHYQFEQISKAEILRKLKQRFGTKIIREIRFRVG